MDDKIIVSNLSALKAKYKTSGVSKIKKACDDLIAADKKRDLATRVIYLDDAKAMKKVGGTAVTNPKDARQNKRAIDAIFNKLRPDYLMILGSIDVIPHQDMKNPVFDPPDDPDAFAYGDLPYACEKAYSKKPEDFVGPTRVVGRLPDLVGATEPSYLVALMKTAATFKTRPWKDYAGYFAISTEVWKGSTLMSLDNLFGMNDKLNLSPDKGPKWTATELKKKLHFINCHGAPASAQFLGQRGKKNPKYPIAHDASLLKNKIVEGTVAAVECCYGAEQYDSFTLGGGQMSIGNVYLKGKAYGFFGSSTIAYGPEDDNGSADLICQYFLKYVMEGASVGRAALQARQDFASSSPNLDPVDLKTIAQFYLLGDPSVVPIESSEPNAVDAPKKKTKSVESKAIERNERRVQLLSKGLYLAKNQPVVSSKAVQGVKASLEPAMKRIAAKVNIKNPNFTSFKIQQKAAAPSGMKAKSIAASAFHVMREDGTKSMKSSDPVVTGVCVVAKEVNGNIVSYRELHPKSSKMTQDLKCSSKEK